ncbi:cytosol aminopeptidase-like isoform X2 [Macrosteles quadrilineatus]|uniref:cytosol aminopeptidase-like isoform X2 n=1 Tax=Macrosteles quadrilineatus TaxID=74068 RepID=UPI0023E201CE|nr:cytosol aminopeptidase-like isoform X2 [Macrosteles quadrilineatus]
MAACLNGNRTILKTISNLRNISSQVEGNFKKGLVLGAYYDSENDSAVELTPAGQKFNEEQGGNLSRLIQIAGPGLKKGKVRVFHDLCPEFGAVAVVGLGKPGLGYNEAEEIFEDRESVRAAAAAGCRSLQDIEKTEVWVEGFGNPEAAAEGATLGLWLYQEHKNLSKQKKIPVVHCLDCSTEQETWLKGVVKGESQNLARKLSDTPANLMTPTIFAKNATEALSSHGVDVIAHNAKWAEDKKMGSFLSVTRGSEEPPVFLEMAYKGGNPGDQPVVLVGKGVTFDSGGISLKPSLSMDAMRADMGGAACVVATLHAAARLKLPLNIIGLTPLCENMPGGRATKPGDVVVAMNGKTIQVDNTDAEGRLILADALCYAAQFSPRFTLDIATLTGAMKVALGAVATGVFSNSTALWQQLQQAGAVTGDRVWRFPLWEQYSKRMTDFASVDVNNVGKGKGGGSCTAAAFLKEFAPPGDWMHLDIAGTMFADDYGGMSYLQKGMTGRPTRTLIQLLVQIAGANKS